MNIKKLVSHYFFFIIPVIILVITLPVIGISFWKEEKKQETIAKLENLVNKYPSDSFQAKRFQSMIDAIQHGKTTYTYQAPAIPVGGK